MVNCNDCNYEGYGIDMVVVKGEYLCPACASDTFIELYKKIKKLKEKIKKNKILLKNNPEDCCYDYKKQIIKENKQLKQDVADCQNWIGKVTEALEIPEDASSGRALGRIKELKDA